MAKKVLIVVDMQTDFITGSLANKSAYEIVDKVNAKIDEYTRAGDIVIFTRDTHNADYLTTMEGTNLPIEHCIKDTLGWEIFEGIYVPENAIFVDKPNFGYVDWDKVEALKDAARIELVGTCTDICVISNGIALKMTYPETTICCSPSCCAGLTPELHDAAIQVMKSCQIMMLD